MASKCPNKQCYDKNSNHFLLITSLFSYQSFFLLSWTFFFLFLLLSILSLSSICVSFELARIFFIYSFHFPFFLFLAISFFSFHLKLFLSFLFKFLIFLSISFLFNSSNFFLIFLFHSIFHFLPLHCSQFLFFYLFYNFCLPFFSI